MIAWSAENKRLTHDLFNILQGNYSIRSGIWPRNGMTTSSQIKAIHQKNIARKLFKIDTRIRNLLEYPNALSHYATAVKHQLAKPERMWKKAEETLGITGAGLLYEDAILGGTKKIRNKWDEVK